MVSRRLQKDAQLLRQDLNEAEVDRENLSLGLHVASVHYQVTMLRVSLRTDDLWKSTLRELVC